MDNKIREWASYLFSSDINLYMFMVITLFGFVVIMVMTKPIASENTKEQFETKAFTYFLFVVIVVLSLFLGFNTYNAKVEFEEKQSEIVASLDTTRIDIEDFSLTNKNETTYNLILENDVHTEKVQVSWDDDGKKKKEIMNVMTIYSTSVEKAYIEYQYLDKDIKNENFTYQKGYYNSKLYIPMLNNK